MIHNNVFHSRSNLITCLFVSDEVVHQTQILASWWAAVLFSNYINDGVKGSLCVLGDPHGSRWHPPDLRKRWGKGAGKTSIMRVKSNYVRQEVRPSRKKKLKGPSSGRQLM